MEMSGGEALAQQLVLEGVTDIFGVPGVQLDYAIDGLAQVHDKISFCHTRHEQAAAYMADGYSRTTGKIGVCMVVPGPGMLNAMAALSTAYACSSPVLAIVGQIPSTLIGADYGILHEVRDQSHTLGTVTKWTGIARTPEEVPQLVHDAFRELRSGSPAPVGIEIPPDVLKARAEISLIDTPQVDAPIAPDISKIREAAALLAAAGRPVIYVGGGVLAAGAWNELRELAELIQAPVVMSLHGRSAIDNRHPLALTSLAGREVLPTADVVLAVGSRFIDGHAHQIGIATDARLILLNSRANDLGDPRHPAVAIHADARLGLAALRDDLEAVDRPGQAALLDSIRARADEKVALVQPQASWIKALRDGIPEDGILVNELTQVGFLAEVGYPVYGPHTYITPGYQGTLGYGFATALGAKVANPDRVVVSINGDGGFGWNLQELASAKLHGIGLITVVFADGTFGNVQRMQRDQFGGRLYATELANPDFVKLAEAFGVTGVRARTPEELTAAIREGAKSGEPLLIEVPMDKLLANPWHLIH